MKTVIYYFTGSGNSLLVAKELAKRLPGSKLVPLASLLDGGTVAVTAEAAGFVFPLHGLTAPIPVRRFLKAADFSGAKYLFAVANRGGTRCLAFEKMNGILAAQGRKLDATFIITLPNNDPKFKTYDVPTKEDFAGLEKKIAAFADKTAAIVARREQYAQKDEGYVDFSRHAFVNRFMENLVVSGMTNAEKTRLNGYYYADEKCTGCGICEKTCPSTKIKMDGGKPVWQTDVTCFMCYACLNYCPAKAVQIRTKWYMRSYTPKNGRYPHPWADWKDIAAQKKA